MEINLLEKSHTQATGDTETAQAGSKQLSKHQGTSIIFLML